MMLQQDNKNIYKICLDLLSRREHSRYELQQKLLKHTQNLDVIDEVLAHAKSKGYLSENRFVENFIRAKINKGYGPNYIRQALKQKRAPIELIEKNLNEEINWDTVAKRVYQKKYKDKKVSDYNEKIKRQRFLQSRGFTHACIDELFLSIN